MKKFLITVFLLSSILPTYASGGTIVTYVIDPEKNAYLHNNKGVEYVKEQCYYAAIQEFKMAISLNPQKQATAIYFNNLGKVYMTIGYPELALDWCNNAITPHSLNFEYYQNLADCYKKLGQSKSKLQYYRSSTSNPLNKDRKSTRLNSSHQIISYAV